MSNTTNTPQSPTGPIKPPSPPRRPGFEALDINEDGVLSGTETKKLEGFDADKDGQITKDEFVKGRRAELQAFYEKRREGDFGKLDINKDGVLSGTEAEKLKAYDKDSDGKITEAEYHDGRKAAFRGKVDREFEDAFAKLDINDDDILSGTEAERLRTYDKDGDGKLTKAEYLKGRWVDRHEQRNEELLEGNRPATPEPTPKPVERADPAAPVESPSKQPSSSAQALLKEINALRRTEGLKPLEMSPAVSQAAEASNDKQAADGKLGLDDALKGELRAASKGAYEWKGLVASGEADAREVIALWRRQGLLKDLLNPKFEAIGVARTLDAEGKPYWTAVALAP